MVKDSFSASAEQLVGIETARDSDGHLGVPVKPAGGSIQPLQNVPLASFTTLGVGGPARIMVEATTEGHILEALELGQKEGMPVFILGGGSNVLISDRGFPGLVLRIALRGVDANSGSSRGMVTAAAGEDWDSFVARIVSLDFAGIECLSGIPGTVGGTPVQNVGAYGQEVADVITSVRVFDRESFAIQEMGANDCRFDYRSSIFNTSHQQRYIVLSVTFMLRPGGKPSLEYTDLKRRLSDSPHEPTLSETRQLVLKIRGEKAMLLRPGDPDCKSAGSFFKNPTVSEESARGVELIARNRGQLSASEFLPIYAVGAGKVKIPAAWLIEKAGFRKGYGRGRAGISSRHTLAIINRGAATADDIMQLAREIQAGVCGCFGIDLVLEPVLVGF